MSKKVALITGGTKGIGLGIVEKLLAESWIVAFTGRNKENIDNTLLYLRKTEESCRGYICDVRDFEGQKEVVDLVIDTFGRLDLLVANAGIGHFANIEEMTTDQWIETIDVNLTGVFYSIKAALPALKDSKGMFLTIASLAGTNFFPNGAAYNASKFGLVGFTQAVMLDLRNHGIRTSTIMPGSVATHFNGNIPSEKDAWKIQPEDIGQMVFDLWNLPARTLPSKIEVRPSMPPKK
ncbi:MAG: SDR family oxidoreductase [Saprospirales bacterium]|nr:MAG: SDR family oxidoreductase [Saprospirales bacterium]